MGREGQRLLTVWLDEGLYEGLRRLAGPSGMSMLVRELVEGVVDHDGGVEQGAGGGGGGAVAGSRPVGGGGREASAVGAVGPVGADGGRDDTEGRLERVFAAEERHNQPMPTLASGRHAHAFELTGKAERVAVGPYPAAYEFQRACTDCGETRWDRWAPSPAWAKHIPDEPKVAS